jgi:hypothetical protein
MKKARAKIDLKLFRTILKLPFNVELEAVDYNFGDERLTIVLSGDPLPVEPLEEGDRIPLISYDPRPTWTVAGMSLLDDPYPEEDEPEPEDDSMVIPDAPLVIKDEVIKDEEPVVVEDKKPEQVEPEEEVEIKPKKDVNHGKKRRNTKKSTGNTDISV